MLATTYRRPRTMRLAHVAEPEIEHPNDAIVRVTRTCICGSDIHIYNGLVPDSRVGQIIGHEFTGVVEEVGPSVRNLKVGDRVLVPFNIFCGSCYFCQKELYGNCHNVNSQSSAVGGFYGYTHTAGGYDGGQAEYVRVPFADVGPTVIPDDIHIEDAVLLTDAFPTGYQAAEMGDIREGDTVVVFGAGPVGLFAAKSAWFFGAGRVIVVDCEEYRLEFARKFAHCETVNFEEVDDMAVHLKKIGNAMNKGLTLRMNQASVKRHLPRLIEHIGAGHISPREIITHRIPLEDVEDAYDIFVNKRDNCIKPVLIPPSARAEA